MNDEQPSRDELIKQLLPIGPKQIPVWFGCAFVGTIAGSLESIAFALVMHEKVFGLGPYLAGLLARGGYLPRSWVPFFGSTLFVGLLIALSLWLLRRRLRVLPKIRGREKRELVQALFVGDVRGILWQLLFLGVLGYLLMGGNRGNFDLWHYLARLGEDFWGFTQPRHPTITVSDPVVGRVKLFVPWYIRVGAYSLFASVGLLVFRTLWSGLYLLLAPRPAPDTFAEADELRTPGRII